MAGLPRVVTPLGVVEIDIECSGGSTDKIAGASMRLGAATNWWWPDVGGLAVDVVVTPFPSCAEEAWGAVWTLTALRDSVDVRLTARLVGSEEGDPDGDEDLVSLEFEADGHVVCIGGPDSVALARDGSDLDLPVLWGWPRADGSVGPDCRVGGRSIQWWLPALLAGESVQHHVAVTWSPSGGTPEFEDPAWLACDAVTHLVLGPTL